MAGKNIKGITIELNGNAQPLQNALKGVDSQAKKTQTELKDIDKAAKLDPSSVELYTQKQSLLQQAVQDTSQRLDVLKQAQAQVEQQFQNGDIGVEQYRAFQRELSTTEATLKGYQTQIQTTAQEYDRLKNANKDLQTFFQATGTEVSQFADVLGTRLTTAISNGTASADQINRALNLMGRQALGASADIGQMRQAMTQINSSGLNGVRQEFAQIARAADEAGDEVNGFGDKLKGVAAGLVAGGGIALAFEQALDVSTLNTNIDISMNLNEEDTKAVRQSIMETTVAIGDEEAAYEGVRRQLTLNKGASIETNQEIIQGASMISKAYKEIDFKELIQESHEIGKELKISQQDALALTNQLLSVGFPPEQLDIIAEYGGQLQRAGFDAEQVQAIMAAGVETGTWNIDNLLDGLKEGRIKAAEMGAGLSASMADALQIIGGSEEQFRQWGVAIAQGGEKGNKAFQDMTQYLMNVEDDVARNALGVELFGTMWEDQGENIAATILNMNDHLQSADEMQNKFNDDVAKMKADAAYALGNAIGKLKESFAPLLADIAQVIAKIANWASENTTLVAILLSVGAVIAGIVAACMALAPVIMTLTAGAGGLTAALAILTSPVTLIIAGIAALIAALVWAYTEFESFRNIVDSVFSAIKEVVSAALGAVVTFIQEKLAEIKSFWDENGATILQAVTNVWNTIKAVFEFVMPFIMSLIQDTWNNIKSVIDGVLNVIMGLIKTFSGLLTGDWSKMWEGIKQFLSGAVQAIWNIVELWFIGKILKVFKSFGDKAVELMKSMGDKLKGLWDAIANFAKSAFDKVKDFIMTPVNAAKKGATDAFNSLKQTISTVATNVWTVVSDKFGALKDLMLNPVNAAKEGIDKAIKAIKGFFSGLSLKFPEIKMPKLPSFTIDGKFGLNPPSVPKLGIKWNAEGGIFTSPTIFNTANAGLQGVGEAGAEAILPLTPKVLAGIGKGIAQQMTPQSQIVYVQPSPVYMDGQLVGEITFDTINSMQYNSASINAITKGVNL
ncbi:phage tail protein [Lysinibacillus capsici]|uniref:phage tail protein n=1 Tax=Lysinibacillus capsici TaxID=2115968 RepID=UPI000E209EFE|nr:hypothetical protein [Lysinibacillus capsici]RDV27117.1 hypothetical protein C7B89_19970 [Lysinibacillus capsici]